MSRNESSLDRGGSGIDPGDLLFADDALQDPYAIYDALRTTTPIAWSERVGTWIVFSHELVRLVYRDQSRFSSAGSTRVGLDALPERVQADLPMVRFVETFPALSQADPPIHTHHRRAVARPLSPRRMEAMRDWVEDLCVAQLAELEAAPDPELIRDYSAPLAFNVILGLFGVPTEYSAMFIDAGLARSRFHSYGYGGSGHDGSYENAYAYEQSLVTLRDTLDGIVSATPPGDATLVAQMALLLEEHVFTSAEVFQILKTFFTAAHENLVYALPIAMSYLLLDPRQRAMVQSNPTLAAGAYEEAVRMEPHNLGNRRRVVDDCEFGGVLMRKDDAVLALKAAANRDPSVWTRPNEFDLTRNQNEPEGGNVTFGQGIHFCVGAGLARLVGPASIRVLFDRFPAMQPAPGWRRRFDPIPGTRKLSDLRLQLYANGGVHVG